MNAAYRIGNSSLNDPVVIHLNNGKRFVNESVDSKLNHRIFVL